MATKKILVIVTNVGEYENVGFRTGLWLGELTHFWDVIEKVGYTMDLASPDGGFIPLAPESLSHEFLNELGTINRYKDRDFMDLLQNTKKISDTKSDDYDAIYLTGGHGVMYDFPNSEDLEMAIAQCYESGRVVSAVCQGPTGLLNAKLGNGDFVIKGKKVTGFSWPEEVLATRDKAVPFNLEEEMGKRGANYTKAAKPLKSTWSKPTNSYAGRLEDALGAACRRWPDFASAAGFARYPETARSFHMIGQPF